MPSSSSDWAAWMGRFAVGHKQSFGSPAKSWVLSKLTKYVTNGMLATRISFMNELAMLVEALSADVEQVRHSIGSDARIGTHFLYAGCGWGGSCFPKGVKALLRTGVEASHPLTLLQLVVRINERQRALLANRVEARLGSDLRGHRLALWGLAFKPGTDDLREAPSRTIVDALVARGASALLPLTESREFRSPYFTALRALLREPVVFDSRNQ